MPGRRPPAHRSARRISSAQAHANGGAGANSLDPLVAGGDGGEAHASAHGSSPGGSLVVEAVQVGGSGGEGAGGAGRGADSTLENATTFSGTPGDVLLNQGAYGGNGGNGAGSIGGNARSWLGAVVNDRGRVYLASHAFGGDAFDRGESDGAGPRGGDASAGAVAIDRSGFRVQILVDAEGGDAVGAGGIGGRATLEKVRGSSTAGADVSVSGQAKGGSGDVAQSVQLVDAVTGDTSGILELKQTAIGGNSRVSAGSATSRLTHSGSLEQLFLESVAEGGDGNDGGTAPGVADGADARASVKAENDVGDSHATARAEGGAGGYVLFGSTVDGADGGSAESTAKAIGHAAHHRVTAASTAIGGAGSDASYEGRRGGDGGAAVSETRAISTADAPVYATDRAVGGQGGGAPWPIGVPGAGGEARSSALAQGEGSSGVVALSTAVAGLAGGLLDPPQSPPNGAAFARALAIGPANVSAVASAQGGGILDATSEARANGPVTSLRSHVSSGETLSARYTDPLPEVGSTAAIAAGAWGGGEYAPMPRRGHANAYALPDADSASAWLAESPNAGAVVASGADVLALGWVGGGAEQGLAGRIELTLDADLCSDETELSLAFLDTFSVGNGLDVLHLELSGNGRVLFEREFEDTASAMTALDDTVFAFADADLFDGDLAVLVLSFQLEFASPEDGFLAEFALLTSVSADEPPITALALVLGFALLAVRVRSDRRNVPRCSVS